MIDALGFTQTIGLRHEDLVKGWKSPRERGISEEDTLIRAPAREARASRGIASLFVVPPLGGRPVIPPKGGTTNK